MEWPSKYFKASEVLSPDGIRLLQNGVFPMSVNAVIALDKFRSFVGSPLICNHDDQKLRGFRSPNEYQRIKKVGQAYSFHLWCAFDLTSEKVLPEELFSQAKAFCHSRSHLYAWGGIGLYSWGVHVDLRTNLSNTEPTIWRENGN